VHATRDRFDDERLGQQLAQELTCDRRPLPQQCRPVHEALSQRGAVESRALGQGRYVIKLGLEATLADLARGQLALDVLDGNAGAEGLHEATDARAHVRQPGLEPTARPSPRAEPPCPRPPR